MTISGLSKMTPKPTPAPIARHLIMAAFMAIRPIMGATGITGHTAHIPALAIGIRSPITHMALVGATHMTAIHER